MVIIRTTITITIIKLEIDWVFKYSMVFMDIIIKFVMVVQLVLLTSLVVFRESIRITKSNTIRE